MVDPITVEVIRAAMNARGEIVVPLDVEQAHTVAYRLREAGVEAIAVCFLHAYANPTHELQMARILQEEYPTVQVSLSHHISREWREYERTSTTVINAYIQPIVERYLRAFDRHLLDQGFTGTLLIMQSNGGLMPAERTRQRPVCTIESGPTAGAIATGVVGNLLNLDQLISFEMGGTTAKTCLVQHGTPHVSAEALRGTRHVYFEGRQGFVECLVYYRDILQAGNVVVGPAVVEEYATVTLVYSGDRLVVNPYGLLEIQIR